MGKWIAAFAAAGIIALVVLMWIQLHETPTIEVAKPAAAPPAPQAPKPEDLAKLGAEIKKAETRPDGKLSPNSDEFFYKFSESQPKRLSAAAAKCYTGGINRVGWNAMLRLTFEDKVENGEVTVVNLKIAESTITDQKLIDCFVREVQNTHWHDDSLPNVTDPDELVIRPERGLKKYTEENKNYEGAGPDFTNHKYE